MPTLAQGTPFPNHPLESARCPSNPFPSHPLESARCSSNPFPNHPLESARCPSNPFPSLLGKVRMGVPPEGITMQLIAALHEPAARLPALAGGKGASLARMTAAGLPVPVGFVVTTNAFRAAAGSLPAPLFERLAAAGPSDHAALETACSDVRRAITEAGVPAEAAEAVRAAYRRLGGARAVSVRSSATAEDLVGASFAGQYDTFLNVVGEDAVLEAVGGVWASMYSAHAVAYRLRIGMDANDGSMAVVVQAQLAPDAAGVMFTRHPVSEREDRYLVNAALGLGEGVVSGEVPADSFELDAATLAVVGQAVAAKNAMLAPAGSGVERAEPPPERWHTPALDEGQLARLGAYGKTLAEMNGAPQDVEFAVVGDDVHVLQSRPITGPFDSAPFRFEWEDPDDERRLWTRDGGPRFKLEEDSIHHRQRWLSRCFRETAVGRSLNHRYRIINGFLYNRPSDASESEIEEIRQRYLEKELAYRREGSTIYKAEIEPRTIHLLNELEAFNPKGASLPELVRHLELAMESDGEIMGHLHWASIRQAGDPTGWPEAFERLTGEPKEGSAVFLQALPHRTARLIGRLRGLARLAQQDPNIGAAVAGGDYEALKARRIGRSPEGRRFLERFRRLLRDYGHRTGYGYGSDTGFDTPTWNMEPGRVLDVLAMYARLDLDRLDALDRAAREARPAAGRRIRRKLAPRPGTLAEFERELADAQADALLMENHNHIMEQGVTGAFREAMHYVGVGLVEAGHAGEPDDALHLSLDEIRSLAAGDAGVNARALVAERKAELAARRKMRPPQTVGSAPPAPEGGPNPGYDPPADAGLQGTVLRGVSASPGRATGRAVVVMGGAKPPAVRRGDIVVAPNAGPAWTPMFPVLGGIVLDAGGILQHAAVISREYGIPAVLMTRDATTVIMNGQTITVDGAAGAVDLAPQEP